MLLEWLLTWPADEERYDNNEKEEHEDGEGDGNVAASIIQSQLLSIHPE